MSGGGVLQRLWSSRVLLLRSQNGSIAPPKLLPLLSRGVHSSACFRRQATEEDESLAKGDKVLKVRVGSLRLDAVLKAGLQISRSKIEKAFYDDRIRVNGDRAKKKSVVLADGDEVDIVRGTNKLNPSFIDVSRVEIVDVGDGAGGDDEGSGDDENEERLSLTLKRYKLLTIQNYTPPWKGPPSD